MNEALHIPKFTLSDCRLFTACGRLTTTPDEILLRFAQFASKTAEVILDGTPHYVRLLGHKDRGDRAARHLHIDVATTAYFKRPPRIDAMLDEIADLIKSAQGSQLELTSTSGFETLVGNIPEDSALRSMLGKPSQSSVDDTTIKITQTAATLQFEGLPVKTLNWEIIGEKLSCELVALSTVPVSPKYLIEAHAVLDTAYQAIVKRPAVSQKEGVGA